LESQVCPSSGEEEEPLCFIRNLAQKKEWDKLKNTWSKKVSFATLDYENLKEEHVEISKNTYAILLKKLKLFEEKI